MWPPIGGWLLIRVAAHSRFYCNCNYFSSCEIRLMPILHLQLDGVTNTTLHVDLIWGEDKAIDMNDLFYGIYFFIKIYSMKHNIIYFKF